MAIATGEMWDVVNFGTKLSECEAETENGIATTAIYSYDGGIYVVSSLNEYSVAFNKL